MSSQTDHIIRITVVGNGTTGKTCLLIVYKDKIFNPNHIPTVFDSYSMELRIGDTMRTIILNDTAGQEDYINLRPLAYNESDVFVLCYAVNSRVSFVSIKNEWIKELRHYRPQAKIILVATKTDLRETCTDAITTSEGKAMAKKINAASFVECSSMLSENVDTVFREAVLSHLQPKKQRRNSCVLL